MNGSLSWQRKVLSNGLTVLLYNRSSAMTAQLSLAIRYGSNDDSEDKIGSAHFLEHMLVGGSRERIKLHHEIESFGGASGFETSKECTFSIVDVFPERLLEASKVLSGLIFDTCFEKDKLEHERKVILQELAEASDDPRDKTEETLLKCLFRNHPAKNPILGSRKTVSQITLRDLEQAHERYYCPRNMILILTGKFSDRDADSMLEDFENRENGSPISRQKINIGDENPRKEAIMRRSGITQAYLSFGLTTPPAKDADVPALELINAILGTGESSRLFVELREKRSLTYDCSSVNVSGFDFGYFLVNCAVRTNSLKQTQMIIQDELQKLKIQPVPRNELEKGKNLVLSSVFRSVDSPYMLPRVMTDSEMYFADENTLSRYIEKVSWLSDQDITEVADKYFQENRYATAIVTPKPRTQTEAHENG
ncbi:MAG TPA: pitrilysin family protein [Candidatus Bathyarchaeia archaeon]